VKENYKERAKEWGRKMIKLCGHMSLRIYPHILICHGEDLVTEFGALRLLNQQGFENANALHNFDGQRHTNHIMKKGLRKRKREKEKQREGESEEKEDENEEEEIIYITLSSNCLSQTMNRNSIPLLKPPTPTSNNPLLK